MNELDLMSPSKVAEKYGGDKRKIAQAARMGVIDPTVAVMAGMFIDRMRGAAAKEQAPQTTVAQDVMAEPSSGVAALPVPDEMFGGEQGFAGGGIVAFEDGGLTGIPGYETLEDLGIDFEPTASISDLDRIIAQATERRRIPLSEAEVAYQKRLKSSPERAKEAKERSFNEFLVESGFRTAASKSPRFLQAIGEAGAASTPRLTAGAKEAREIEEAGMKGLADIGKGERAQQLAGISAGEKMYGEQLTREGREKIAKLQRESIEKVAREKQTDFQRKWALYTEDTKKRGVQPDIREFQRIFPDAHSGDSLATVIKNNQYGDPATWYYQAAQLDRLKSLQGRDREAVMWALDPENKDTPEAKAIRKLHGI